MKKDKGYVLLLAVLISSIILAMSLGIFSISLKEIALATFARDSVKAFAAASRGLECAMFVDRINRDVAYSAGKSLNYFDSRTNIKDYTPFAKGNDPSISFALLGNVSEDPWTPTNRGIHAQVDCFGATNISISSTSTGLRTGSASFQYEFTDGTCSIIDIQKNNINTSFNANGYSDRCNSTNPRRTQRTISVTVNI